MSENGLEEFELDLEIDLKHEKTKKETCDDHWYKNSPCPYKHNKDGTIKMYKSIYTNWVECPEFKKGYQ